MFVVVRLLKRENVLEMSGFRRECARLNTRQPRGRPRLNERSELNEFDLGRAPRRFEKQRRLLKAAIFAKVANLRG